MYLWKGRMSYSDLDERLNQPIIIPYGHPVSTQIVRHEHNVPQLGMEWCLAWHARSSRLLEQEL